jgi:hypothetical protein
MESFWLIVQAVVQTASTVAALLVSTIAVVLAARANSRSVVRETRADRLAAQMERLQLATDVRAMVDGILAQYRADRDFRAAMHEYDRVYVQFADRLVGTHWATGDDFGFILFGLRKAISEGLGAIAEGHDTWDRGEQAHRHINHWLADAQKAAGGSPRERARIASWFRRRARVRTDSPT